MIDVSVNALAVISAAVLNMAVGMLWYGPLFGKPWMKHVGMTPEKLEAEKKKGMGKTMALAFAASLVIAYALAVFAGMLGITDASGGAKLGVMLWLGFLATTQLDGVLWEGRPKELYGINVSYRLATFVLMAVLVAVWR